MMSGRSERGMSSSTSARALAASLILITILVLAASDWLLTPNNQPDLVPSSSSSSSSVLCDLSQGVWIPDPSPPLYTNATCKYMNLRQNCLQNGRPDRGYLHWRWKPFACELPPFNAGLFLNLTRGKKLAFIGDSLALNHMQALLCALSQVEDPLNLYSDPIDHQYKWLFPSHNFTLTNVRSPFLVNYTTDNDVYKLYLDVPHARWQRQLAEYDIAVLSTGYWYFRKSLHYVNNTIVGASVGAEHPNMTTADVLSPMRIALANVLKHMAMEYKGVTILRTVTVDHFENGSWSAGGMCKRTSPFSHQNEGLPWMVNQILKVQREEFEKAMTLYGRDALKLKLNDVTYSAFLRPDGHPGSYRIARPNDPLYDCLHWCLPGPIDMWNQLLLHTLQPDKHL